MASDVFEKLVNNSLVDHLEKCQFFSNFQFGFWFCQATADYLTVSSDRIASAFNRSGPTRTVALDIPKTFDKVFILVSVYFESPQLCMQSK